MTKLSTATKTQRQFNTQDQVQNKQQVQVLLSFRGHFNFQNKVV